MLSRFGLVAASAILAPIAIGAQTGEVIADAESYAVYAAAVQNRLALESKQVARITLLGETRAGDLEAPCLSSDRIYPEWQSVVANYRAENASSRIIEPPPDFAVPYSLVTYADLTTMMQNAGYDLSKFSGRQSPGYEVFQRLPGGRLIAVSAVGFDATKTRATLVIQYDCFPSQQPGYDRNRGLCHSGNHFFMEKRDGRWMPAKPGNGGCGAWIA